VDIIRLENIFKKVCERDKSDGAQLFYMRSIYRIILLNDKEERT
jgi:hypothetical protein